MNNKHLSITSVIFPILSLLLYSAVLYGDDQSTFLLKKDGKIDVQIDNRPLNQILRELATKFSIDLKGISVGGETVNLSLSDASLEELLKKMMRGYNYVLVRPEKSDKLMLMVLSRADRTKYVDAPAQAASTPPPIPQPVPQATPVTSPRPQQTQRQSTPSRRDSIQPPPASSGLTGSAGASGSTSGTTASPSGSTTPSQSDSPSPPTPPSAGLNQDILPPMPPGFTGGGAAVAASGTGAGIGAILGSGAEKGTGSTSSGATGTGSGVTSSGGSATAAGTGIAANTGTVASDSSSAGTGIGTTGSGSTPAGTGTTSSQPDPRPPQIPFWKP